jgi:hypothetical protein
MNEFPLTPPIKKSPPVVIVLIIFLGLGCIAFGTATFIFYNQAHTATTTLDTQKAVASATARNEQKASDDAGALAVAQSPFRTYTAPDAYGAFKINFPKNWSAYVDLEQSSQTQVTLTLNPDVALRQDGADGLAATRVLLIQKSQADYLKDFGYDKATKQSTTTVSGITSISLTGTFSDKRSLRQVVVPVRDKVLVFISEAPSYSNQFDQILAQAKIVP